MKNQNILFWAIIGFIFVIVLLSVVRSTEIDANCVSSSYTQCDECGKVLDDCNGVYQHSLICSRHPINAVH